MTYKFNFLIIPLFFLCNILTANDGGFYASGNTLIPLSKTSIELRKEYLNLTFEDNGFLRVDIQFEFFNPGNETELIVGFVNAAIERMFFINPPMNQYASWLN